MQWEEKICCIFYLFLQNYRKRWFVLSGGPREGGYTLTFYKVRDRGGKRRVGGGGRVEREEGGWRGRRVGGGWEEGVRGGEWEKWGE